MRLDWRGVLGILLSIAFLWWALSGVSWSDVLHNLRAADPWLLAAATIVATACIPLRAVRWRIILEPVDASVPTSVLWRSTAIGVALNNVMPARLGEVARAYALTREAPAIPFTAAFASLAVDRVFDAVAVVLLMALALVDPAYPRHDAGVSRQVSHVLGLGALFAAGALVLLYLLVFLPERVLGLYGRLARRITPRFEARGREVLLAFAAGLGVLRSPRRFAAVLAWTLAFWALNGLSFWLAFRAFGIDVSVAAAMLVQGVVVVGVALPQAPGFVGVFEAAARWSLAEVYGVSSALAVSWAIGFHVLSFIPITLIGLYYFVRLGVHLRELNATRGPRPASTAPMARHTTAEPNEAATPAASGAADVVPRRR